MSAPTSKDPLFVNTAGGQCWKRQHVDGDGRGLYALADVVACPAYVLASFAELAELGISGSADVLPVPVGPEPRTLDVVEHELTGARLSLYEEELETARLRLALKSAQRGRRELRDDLQFAEGSRQRWRRACIEAEGERDALKARVAELEALTPARIQTCRVCGAGYTYGESCSICEFRKRMAAELQARGLDGEHYPFAHHNYRVPRDLPETGGQR